MTYMYLGHWVHQQNYAYWSDNIHYKKGCQNFGGLMCQKGGIVLFGVKRFCEKVYARLANTTNIQYTVVLVLCYYVSLCSTAYL